MNRGDGPEPLSSRLRRLRVAKGWTQRQLAAAAGLTHQAVGHLETGTRRKPLAETLLRLGEALGVNPRELLG